MVGLCPYFLTNIHQLSDILDYAFKLRKVNSITVPSIQISYRPHTAAITAHRIQICIRVSKVIPPMLN
jgi:hypothetical protein